MNRSFDIIGKISRYDNWNISLVANGIDEISFNVHKYADGKICPIWDELIDLKIVDVDGFGRFEISVDYTDNTETVKSIHGLSLEAELAQIMLYEFHVNEEEAADNDSSKDNYDSKGNYIPTTFYREIDPDDTNDMIEFKRKHSLLDRVLADKAPHWSIGHVTSHIALSEEIQPELSSDFQRTYTVDGDSIYDFLTGTVAEESNVVFVFDTIERKINCYSLCDCIDQKTGIIFCNGIGKDTTIFVSKNKLANEITISSNKDNVKNCFRIEGGDDIITDMVRAVNMNGSNYIFQFADFQYNDMSEGLREKITEYQNMMSSKETQDEYYGENGIYSRLCAAYDDLYYYESSMMPNTDKVTEIGTAKEQYEKLFKELNNSTVAVSSMNNYNNNLFVGVTNNIEAYAQIFLDSRFDLEIVSETTSYSYTDGAEIGTWEGKIRIKQHTDETNVYPTDISAVSNLKVIVNDDTLEFAKQKIHKALSKGSMLDIDFKVAEMDEAKMKEYFNLYSFNRLTSFYDGYNSCISILTTLGKNTTSDVRDELYDSYKKRLKIVEEIKETRQYKIWDIEEDINVIKMEQNTFLYGGTINGKKYKPHDFKTYIGEDLYLEFSRYRREDTYKNDNYISDGKSTSECMEIAKKLIEAATKEAKKACVLQRTVSTSLNNLFALPEFEPLYDKFALFNYIRIRTEDEILKLRLIGIEFNGESVEEIQVTFSEQIESIDGTVSDLQSIIQQAGNMATSYSSTVLQAKKGSEAKLTVSDMFRHGLNAAKTMLTNNDNNEVTITPSGIICRRMDDEGFYGNKQIRITGNIMAFTKDNWESVELAIGEATFYNPFTKQNEINYGILASAIVGELIVGKNLFIGDEDGNVQITGDGIKIAKGTIAWGKDSVNAPEIENINGLKNSLTSIEGNLEQLDGRIQTYSQSTDPKTTGSTKWSDSDNAKHLGDVWVNTGNGVVYVFAKEGSTYKWIETQDSNLKALAQSKAQVFTSKSGTISNGYSIGDLWILESDIVLSGYKKGTVLIANANAGKNNTFNKNHWQEATVKKATDALEQVTEISDDSKVTPSEKQQLKLIWTGIISEKATLEESAKIYGVTYSNYKTAYDNLEAYLSTILSNLNTTTNISTFDTKFQNYYDERDILQKAVDETKKKYVDDSIENVNKNISDFQDKVNHALMGNATTSIGKDYVISPKIGGGYMYITGNNKISIEINPEGTEFDGHNGDYVFNISKDDDLIMGVDNEGNGHFSWKITGSEISAGTITGTTISGGTIAGSEISGVEISGSKIDGAEINGGTIKSEFIDPENNRYYTEISNSSIISEDFLGKLNIYGSSIEITNKSETEECSLNSYGICLEQNGIMYFRANTSVGLDVQTKADFRNPVSIFSSLDVTGDTTLSGSLNVNGETKLNGALNASGVYYADVGTRAPNLMIGDKYYIKKTSGSSKRFKNDIKSLKNKELNPNKLYDVDVVQYKFKKDYLSEDDQRYNQDVIGFIAEDIFEKYPIAADYSIDEDGKTIVNDWNYRYIVPAMLKLIQDQKKEIEILKLKINI